MRFTMMGILCLIGSLPLRSSASRSGDRLEISPGHSAEYVRSPAKRSAAIPSVTGRPTSEYPDGGLNKPERSPQKQLKKAEKSVAARIFSSPVQQPDTTFDGIVQFPNRLFARIKNKTDRIDEQLTRRTEKYLERLARKERKLRKKIYAKDSLAANNLFAGSEEKYLRLEQQIKNAAGGENDGLRKEYLPYLDSLKGSLSFLQKNQELIGNLPGIQNKITGSLSSLNQLQSKFQTTEQIKEFIRQRKQQLRNALRQYASSRGLNRYVDQYSKEFYFYAQEVKGYKEELNERDKLGQRTLMLLDKLPSFRDFMQRNSQLAMLFGTPANYGTAAALNGLQTRNELQQILQSQISAAGDNGMASLQSGLESAHEQLNQLKDKLSQFGEGGGDMEMPDFKPDLPTRSFLKKLELGTDFQTSSTAYSRQITNVGLSLGYKLGGKGTVGIGFGYKIGWKASLSHNSLSGEGVNLRLFVDMRLKGKFYLSGGYEENYLQPVNSFQQTGNRKIWQPSGLIGLTRIVALPGKFIKKTKLQLLWDFLCFFQSDRTQAIKFRMGYNF